LKSAVDLKLSSILRLPAGLFAIAVLTGCHPCFSPGQAMKCFTTWILMIAVAGCTTLRPIAANQPDFSQRIASGELLKVHDHVIIETKDRQTYEFDITSISVASVDGKQRSIPINQIASIQKRVLNTRRTLLLALLVAGGVAFTIALVSAFKDAGAAAVLGNSN
jgi:hypothetical protein